MDRKALLRNVEMARRLCPRLVDRIKYLWWIYTGVLVNRRERVMIRFKLKPPIRDLSLTARCNGGSDAFVFSEVFEHLYYDFELAEPPKTIVDAGANIGFTVLFFARKYPGAEIACIEPMPDNVDLLRINLAQNAIDCRVYEKALSVSNEPMKMAVAAKDYGHKVDGIGFGAASGGDTITVGAISVPSLMHEMHWDRINLLKIDIEGYEGVLLQQDCAWLGQVDALCIECHEGFGEAELQNVAATHGFQPPAKVAGTWLLSRRLESDEDSP